MDYLFPFALGGYLAGAVSTGLLCHAHEGPTRWPNAAGEKTRVVGSPAEAMLVAVLWPFALALVAREWWQDEAKARRERALDSLAASLRERMQ